MLRWGGFKSIRYSVGLFVSKWGDRAVGSLTREDGKVFLADIARLSAVIGKSERSRGLGLEALVAFSAGRRDLITVRTRKRIFRQVNHFLDWCVYEGQLESNPFQTVRLVGKVRPAPYAVPTDGEVVRFLANTGERIHGVLLFCLLSGMRSGEASGLLREDLVHRGNLGTFAHIRENTRRKLKTDSAERLVPLHPVLQDLLPSLPSEGPLFPALSVSTITKDFAVLRKRLGLTRPGLVFHSTRKWFVTQCERAGVPEHYTASLVGHASARSENGLTYSIYSAGISDEQKRGIVDGIRLPEGSG
jgi:integrase